MVKMLVMVLGLWFGQVLAQQVDSGPAIAQADAEVKAKELMAKVLKDPYSAVYSWEPIEAGWWKDGLFEGGAKHVGWVLRGTVNSKNSYGGFVGQTPVAFVIRDGEVIAAYMEHRGRSNTRSMRKIH